jgi:hypothetical protein
MGWPAKERWGTLGGWKIDKDSQISNYLNLCRYFVFEKFYLLKIAYILPSIPKKNLLHF